MSWRSRRVPFSELNDKITNQVQQIEHLEEELNNLHSHNQYDWRFVIKQYLSDIRGHIEDLGNRQTELENNNLLLKNKIFHLNQEIEEITINRRKLSSSSKIKPKYHIKSRNIEPITTTFPKTMMFSSTNSSAIHPNLCLKQSPISSPIDDAMEPITPTPSIFNHQNWIFESLKNPMADSNEIEQISQKLGIQTLPEMVFSNSYLKISYPNSLEVAFETINGLKPCLGIPAKEKQIEVQYASEWKDKAKNSKDVERLQYEYDWTYTTNYKGDYKSIKIEGDDEKKEKKKENKDGLGLLIECDVKDRFNMVLLRDTTVPILWSCHCILYEDELSDNGMSQLLVRCRVMPQCFLVLLRYWLRVDNVIIRINDTRIYHEFGKKYILRHYQERESKWERLIKRYPMTQLMQFTDPNLFYEKIDVLNSVYDKLYL